MSEDGAIPAAASAGACASASTWAARTRQHLPLPHVPEGLRLVLRTAGVGARTTISPGRAANLAWFQSSNKVRRGFCSQCGTPLAYDWGGPALELAIGALDEPDSVPPVLQVGLEHRMSWFSRLAALPTRTTPEEQEKVDRFQAEIVSFQHPTTGTPERLARSPGAIVMCS